MTSETLELFVPLRRGDGRTLGRQIEDAVRSGIRSGTLRAGRILPSTRDLAAQLGISRPIVVDAYAQLAAEGFLILRQGARPRISPELRGLPDEGILVESRMLPARYDFRPAIPDVRQFPRKSWLRATRIALETMRPNELGYDGRHGTDDLRNALANYLGRVRSVLAAPSDILITSGFAQSKTLFCRVIAEQGGRRIAVEDPSYDEWEFARSAGLEIIPVPVDEQGIDPSLLARTDADAVLLTPTHQSPTGAVLSGARRAAIIQWLRARGAFALEDDYDAEFRYDRPAVGALQGLAADRIVYAGTSSKMLAPGLRLGWVVVPPLIKDAMQRQHRIADFGAPRIDQNALAALIESGDLDRHLRRVRLIYRKRRDALIQALASSLPEGKIAGIAAGLHATVALPYRVDEAAVIHEAARRGVRLEFLSHPNKEAGGASSTLLLGYAQLDESTIRQGLRVLVETLRGIATTTRKKAEERIHDRN